MHFAELNINHQVVLILWVFWRRCRRVLSADALRSLLETADQCFIGHLVYYYSISNYFNPIALQQATMTWYAICIPACCVVSEQQPTNPNQLFRSFIVSCHCRAPVSRMLTGSRTQVATDSRGKSSVAIPLRECYLILMSIFRPSLGP